MNHLNVEIKAKCDNPSYVRAVLKEQNAKYKGLDHQIDTYFRTRDGRLKLREGNIENFLIHYKRTNQAGPKQSHVNLVKTEPKSGIKQILTDVLGVQVVVEKQREIYFIDNVKFHIDNVKDLGNFVEIEAIDFQGTLGIHYLEEQCNHYIHLFNIYQRDLTTHSYSDMIL